jgi:hypothetical protein
MLYLERPTVRGRRRSARRIGMTVLPIGRRRVGWRAEPKLTHSAASGSPQPSVAGLQDFRVLIQARILIIR